MVTIDMSKEIPIIMQSDSVRNILDGKKTVTRRVLNPPPVSFDAEDKTVDVHVSPIHDYKATFSYSYGQRTIMKDYKVLCMPDDILWVREAFSINGLFGTTDYKADDPNTVLKWKSPLYMKRNQSRIDLLVTSVEIKRLQDMTDSDADKEGIQAEYIEHPEERSSPYLRSAYWVFAKRWDEINKHWRSWGSNPWVQVIGFKLIK